MVPVGNERGAPAGARSGPAMFREHRSRSDRTFHGLGALRDTGSALDPLEVAGSREGAGLRLPEVVTPEGMALGCHQTRHTRGQPVPVPVPVPPKMGVVVMERRSGDADPPSAGRCFSFCPTPRDGDTRGDSAWMSPDPPAPGAAGASFGGRREAETPLRPQGGVGNSRY